VGGVGDIHAAQGTDQALVLEDRLQRPLADLRLVGGVGGIELRPAQDLVHGARHEVVVCSGTEEYAVSLDVGILVRQPAQRTPELDLREGRREVNRWESHRLGDDLEQVGDLLDADRRQHLGPLGVGD
jgi:hypothetical protein